MKTKSNIFVNLLIVLIISLSACSDQDIQGINNVKNQEAFFEVNYVNKAWVDQFKGFIIDKDGQVKTFENPAKWNLASSKAGLTAIQLQENMTYAKPSATTISAEDFKTFTSKIQSITDSSFTKPIMVGADQGITSFYAYRFDPDKLLYTPILLSQTGDYEIHSKDKSAIEISTWLNGILDKVY